MKKFIFIIFAGVVPLALASYAIYLGTHTSRSDAVLGAYLFAGAVALPMVFGIINALTDPDDKPKETS